MRAISLCRYSEAIVSITSPRSSRYLYNKHQSPDSISQSKRSLSFGTSRPARIVDDRRSSDHEERTQAQDQLDDALAFQAAPEIEFGNFKPNAKQVYNSASGKTDRLEILKTLRIIPMSSSYFTGKPRFTDDMLYLKQLLRQHQLLPTVRPGDQPRIAWRDYGTYQRTVGEPIRRSAYQEVVETLRRLNRIHPTMMPEEVQSALRTWASDVQPSANTASPIELDEFGRAAAVGKRKSSRAKAWVVEGDGQIMVNGSPLHETFTRLHDRESSLWALKVTSRLDKYNVFALVHGGGTTGQAEAMTLAVSKALMAHEPMLKGALRKAGCVHRDPRRVERKKPGRLKARKMPTWVKR